MDEGAVPAEPLPWVRTAGAVALAVVLGLLLLPTGLAAVTDGGPSVGWSMALGAALVVLHLSLLPPMALRRPVAMLGVGAAAMTVLVVSPDLGGELARQAGAGVSPVLLPSSLVWFVLLYRVSARTTSPWPSVAVGAGLVGTLLTVVRLWDLTSVGGGLTGGFLGGWGGRLFLVAALVGGTLAAWALGRYHATRTAWTRAVADRAAADERRRIAREMHDVVAHSLAVVVAHAEGGRMVAEREPGRVVEVLDTVAGTGRQALEQMRGLLGVLRDEPGEESGGEAVGLVPQPGLADLPDVVEGVRRAGLPVELETRGSGRAVPGPVGLAVHRMVQESLTNVVRHAGAGARARVVLDWREDLVVTVTDEGGSGLAPASPGPGRGLAGMRERVAAVGGVLEAGPSGSGGWRTCARIPA